MLEAQIIDTHIRFQRMLIYKLKTLITVISTVYNQNSGPNVGWGKGRGVWCVWELQQRYKQSNK